MNIETLRDYCISKAGVSESFPFDNDTLVFKIENKIFLLTSLSDTQTFNVKCNAERAISLREEFEEIKPGFHMNKKHWNTVSFIGSLTDDMLFEMIDHSYDLVFKSLSKIKQQKI
jgi:predicted DNA-binding protein (MmcQ/YjbR family)